MADYLQSDNPVATIFKGTALNTVSYIMGKAIPVVGDEISYAFDEFCIVSDALSWNPLKADADVLRVMGEMGLNSIYKISINVSWNLVGQKGDRNKMSELKVVAGFYNAEDKLVGAFKFNNAEILARLLNSGNSCYTSGSVTNRGVSKAIGAGYRETLPMTATENACQGYTVIKNLPFNEYMAGEDAFYNYDSNFNVPCKGMREWIEKP